MIFSYNGNVLGVLPMKSWDVTLSAKGQVTLPKDLREELNLKPGDQLLFSIIDGQVVVTPKNVDFNDLAGLLGKAPNGPATIEEIDAAVAQAAGANALDTGEDPIAEEAA
jgi:antitoxin PrlF